MNHPWFKFFPGNWIGDTQLRLCSPAARGLLIDCLCMMHEGKRRGYLETATGKPIDDDMLSRLSGTFKGDVYTLRMELIENGVLSVGDDGVPYSRRMVKDSAKSAKCSEAAIRGGGNPSLSNPSQELNTEVRSNIPNANISLKGTFKGDAFDRFWKAYPRKVGKKLAEKAFKKAKDLPPIDELIAEVELQCKSEEWRKDGGQFIPHPVRWLNRGGWEDEVTVKE
jgi:hypothetical protein